MGVILSMLLLFNNIDINKLINTVIYELKVTDNFSDDVYSISNLNDKEINKKLAGTFLEGTGKMMYMIESEKGINFRAVYAIAALESGKGKFTSGGNNYCGIKNEEYTGYREFDSRDECLIFLADILSSKFYRGRTLESIGIDYCPTDDMWASKIKELMGEI
ncbi:mannosyl-glycoprotein endo-beta-N-acetylglucosaminidase [Peptoanaerobacter stomatis]|uniref:Mannosyl-glycoprotein endo-beta-N-acetylglucosaminidase n=1 Tax=Peptoanaerobacter stomatis TaxID=796937 RepID=J6HC09_9FIRM|nr:glucosaminidase domain-containing protein [Peptoanaerobacter stomatis]EJU20353.1 mannosyl-glycoprotein endo-beta-N-acetylglucosaminidase [Peptoanaerobacter stomatis]